MKIKEITDLLVRNDNDNNSLLYYIMNFMFNDLLYIIKSRKH